MVVVKFRLKSDYIIIYIYFVKKSYKNYSLFCEKHVFQIVEKCNLITPLFIRTDPGSGVMDPYVHEG